MLRKRPVIAYFIVIWLCFIAVFSVFRNQIADYAAGLLAMTREITLAELRKGETVTNSGTIKIVAGSEAVVAKNKPGLPVRSENKNKAKAFDYFQNPVTVNLPKTETPVIVFNENCSNWRDSEVAPFPALRKADGTAWDREETEIRGVTDGRKLYLLCRFYDKHTRDAVIKNEAQSACQDDSIEIFLMKDRDCENYCHLMISVGGKGYTYYNKIDEAPNRSQKIEPPKTFVPAQFHVEEFGGGFDFEIKIPLSDIGITKLNPGDSLLMQVIRNYRGQSGKNSIVLQLFPAYIYADSRMGINNHDRRAFQPVLIGRDK